MRAIVKYPPSTVASRPYPLILLAGTSQKADVWRRRMEMLSAAGYECHALDFVQSGRYFTSYAEQMRRLKQYIIERLDGRPILIGHSQGGTKAQVYVLASDGDAGMAVDCSVRAVVLMSSTEDSLLGATPSILGKMVATAGVARTTVAGVLGAIYLDPLCFCFGGGPWRHQLKMYGSLFNESTHSTTLASEHSLSDARVAIPKDHATSQLVPVPAWADTYLTAHDPSITDLGVVARARSPCAARAASNELPILHLVAGNDRIVSRAQSAKVAAAWGVPMTVVDGQGHQLGDEGWERSVMEPLRAFLDAID